MCRPPAGWKTDGDENKDDEDATPDLVAVLLPSLTLAAITLTASLCCCHYIHTGNRKATLISNSPKRYFGDAAS